MRIANSLTGHAMLWCLLFQITTLATPTYYNLIDLGTLGSVNSQANALNLKGEVVGSADDSGGKPQAFLWRNGIHIELKLSGTYGSSAHGINYSGQIVGTDSGSAFLYDTNQQEWILPSGSYSTPGDSLEANGINEAGQIVGYVNASTSDYSGGSFFSMSGANLVSLKTLSEPAAYFTPAAINNSGLTVGAVDSFDPTEGVRYNYPDSPLILDRSLQWVNLHLQSGPFGAAAAVNSHGQIVGGTFQGSGYYGVKGFNKIFSSIPAGYRAVYWAPGRQTDLGTLGGQTSIARGINDAGEIVGASTTSSGVQHGFYSTVESAGNQMLDLNNVLTTNEVLNSNGLGWTVTAANAINNAGEIAGTAITNSGATHAVLLTPATTVLFAMGVYWDNLNGPGNVDRIFSAIRQLRSFDGTRSCSNLFSGANYTGELENRNANVTNGIHATAASLHPGDTLVLYFSSHGDTFTNGLNDPVPTGEPTETIYGPDNNLQTNYFVQSDIRTGDPFVLLQAEYENIAPPDNSYYDSSHYLTGPDLRAALSDPALKDVRKIVIIDSCRSGAFIPQLCNGSIPNIAVIASSTSGWVSYSDPADDYKAITTKALLSGFFTDNSGYFFADSKPRDGLLTVSEWADFANTTYDVSDLWGRNCYLNLLTGSFPYTGQDVVFGKSPDFVDCLNLSQNTFTMPGFQTIYQTSYDTNGLGNLAPYPGNGNQDGYYDDGYGYPFPYSLIESTNSLDGNSLMQVASTGSGVNVDFASRDLPPFHQATNPVVKLAVDFYAHSSDLTFSNAYEADLNVGQKDLGSNLGISILGGYSMSKLQTGVNLYLTQSGGFNQYHKVPLTVGQQLAWDTWHTVELTVDFSTGNYISLTVDGTNQDLTGVPLPLDYGATSLETTIDWLDHEIWTYDAPGETTTDTITWDNLNLSSASAWKLRPAAMTNKSAPVITHAQWNPLDAQTNTVALTVAASGTFPVYYQWQYNGINIANATNATLILSNGLSSYGTNFSVIVYNAYGGATNSSAFTFSSGNNPNSPPAFAFQFGQAGSADGALQSPGGVAVDSNGNIFVADTGSHRIQEFDGHGNFLRKWGGSGTNFGLFNTPLGLAMDASNNVYVADSANHRLQKFSNTGGFLTSWGTLGTGNGQLNHPTSVAVDAAGNVYVADQGNNRIQKFASNGVYATQWGGFGTGNGQFRSPCGIAADSQGFVYVCDRNNNRIQKFTDQGIYVSQWGGYGTNNGQLQNPQGLRADSAGNVYVADLSNNRNQKFTTDGLWICQWGTAGTYQNQFNSPAAIGLDRRGNVYAADSANNRIQVFAYAPIITLPPADQMIATNNNALFYATAAGVAPLNYQWYSNGVAILGATTNYLTIINPSPTASPAAFQVVVTNFLGSITSQLAGLTVATPAPAYNVVHSFGILTNVTGFNPQCQLAQGADGSLYGTTSLGEGPVTGTIFRLNGDGTGFTVLKWFTNAADGANPGAGLTPSGNVLYGTTTAGGNANVGVLYAINTDGTGFKVLKNYNTTDGKAPRGNLTLSGNALFGTTSLGGASSGGTVFTINTDGSGYTVIKNFPAAVLNFMTGKGTNSDGANPVSCLTLSGNTLYGTTAAGGVAGYGTLFRINTDGSAFNSIELSSETPNGVTLSGGTLYGSAYGDTRSGVYVSSYGVVFKINPDLTGYTVLKDFTDQAGGSYPRGNLTLSGGTLYGTTQQGGTSTLGTVFKINTNGTGFTTLKNFAGGNEGSGPSDGLVLSGGSLYGTTTYGGSGNRGTLYKLNPDGSSFTTVKTFPYSDGAKPVSGLTLAGTNLFGTTYFLGSGGLNGWGSVFKVNADGSGYTLVKSFTNNVEGEYPAGGLTAAGNRLFGTTYMGGTNSYGNVFAVNADGTGYTMLHSFQGTSLGDGAYPNTDLILAGNTLFGTTTNGGTGYGTIFKVNTNGSGYAVLKSFTQSTNGFYPCSSLAVSGSTLFGTTMGTFSSSGVTHNGTVFKINSDGTGYQVLHAFTNSPDGNRPCGSLALVNGVLYGTTYGGGILPGYGTVYKIGTNGSGYAVIKNFTNAVEGQNPFSGLIYSGSAFYGTTQAGGTAGNGSVFKINGDGSGFGIVKSFANSTDGKLPYGGLRLSSGKLFGTTYQGGDWNNGTIYSINLAPFITSQPSASFVSIGTHMNLAVSASGDAPLSCQWYKDGKPLVDGGSLAGSASPSLTNSFATADSAGYYAVIITNSYGSVTSSVAGIFVIGQLPAISIGSGGYGLSYTNGQFGFQISSTGGSSVIIQTSTDLNHWTALATNTLVNGTGYFRDTQSSNAPARFYRTILLP